MLIEQGLMTYILAQSAITALVGQRVYFVQAPQDVTKPYIVVTKISGVREHSHDGSNHLARPRFQLSAFSTTYANAKSIASALQTALQGYKGTMGGTGGVAVGAVFYEDETDLYEENTGLYQVALDFFITHGE